ncbi:MAG: DUF3788 domain-containing protein [Clostridiales bacterium]|nr:DUF3788 domain-containing protein [Clostridiales bacterium]
MAYERFLDKSQAPSDAAIERASGSAREFWLDIRRYLRAQYDFQPETVFFTKQCGWSLRYRRGKKTLCTLFPEYGAFTVLIILGKEEIGRSEKIREELSEAVRRVFDTTEQLHDGRWLWVRVTDGGGVRSVKALLAAKAKPKGDR